MWYSWSGTDQPQPEEDALTRKGRPLPTPLPSCFPTILDPRDNTAESGFPLGALPVPNQMAILWRSYLKNVHPLVKIFFKWEIEPIIQAAREDPSSLSKGEQALVFAIAFIATLSISDEDCANLLSGDKQDRLFEFQKCVEDALLLAEFATTSDTRTLQAFVLYLVSHQH